MKYICKLFCAIIALCSAVACNNPGHNKTGSAAFNPQVREHGTLVDESVQAEVEHNNGEYYSSDVKLSLMVPSDQSLTEQEVNRLSSKLLQMLSKFGISGNNDNPKLVLAPVVDILSLETTSTAPTRYLIKYDVTMYVADVVTGTVFNTHNTTLSGIGLSRQEAFLSAMESLNADAGFSDFIAASKTRIIDYYTEQGPAIIKEASTLASNGRFSEAIALLESIPSAVETSFAAAREEITAIIPRYLKASSDDLLVKMKAALGSAPSDTINVAAMEYYQMIPTDSPCKKDADLLYDNYLSKLSSEQAAKTERKMKELEADNEFRLREAELKAEVEGNAMLLEKYKKDAAYDRLPWLRKLIYLGDKDPFDGYEPKHNI